MFSHFRLIGWLWCLPGLLLTAASAAAQTRTFAFAEPAAASVPRHARFEVAAQVDATFPNPYDAALVALDATFTAPSGRTYQVPGFYCQDQDTTAWPYQPRPTPHPWRVRFAPDEPGDWTYTLTLTEPGRPASRSAVRRFACAPAAGPVRPLRIAANGRYLEHTDGTSFFGIGEDLQAYAGTTQPSLAETATPCAAPCYSAWLRPKYRTWLRDFAAHGGNLVRIWMMPTAFELEWDDDSVTVQHTLGNYARRQDRAADLDATLTAAEARGVYINLVVMNPEELSARRNVLYEQRLTGWPANPYRKELGLRSAGEFFTDARARRFFQNKLRYIHARWGYSPALLSYEVMNEIDWVEHDTKAVFNPYRAAVRNWYQQMGTYLKQLQPTHLVTASFAIAQAGDGSGINALACTDFLNTHLYSHDKNALYQYAYLTLDQLDKFRKPFVLTEYGMGECWISQATRLDMRLPLWSTTFSGSFSTAFSFGTELMQHHVAWHPTLIHSFGALRRFLEGEVFNEPRPYRPIGNAYAVYQSYPPDSLRRDARAPDAPWFDELNYACSSWRTDIGGSPTNLRYLADGIRTTHERDVEVFGLQSATRTLGWVHNKHAYWYNDPHTVQPGCRYPANPAPAVPPLPAVRMTVEGLRGRHAYRVEWWSAQHQYDIDQDGRPDDGGLLPAFTRTAVAGAGGRLTLTVPPLQALGQPPFAPDYAFKIIWLGKADRQTRRQAAAAERENKRSAN